MLKGKFYWKVLKTGLLAGALYGAELNPYTTEELTFMTTAAFASERLVVAGVPNYIKEIVLGTEARPAFKVAEAPTIFSPGRFGLGLTRRLRQAKDVRGCPPKKLSMCGTMGAMTMKNGETGKTAPLFATK